jgi:cyclase
MDRTSTSAPFLRLMLLSALFLPAARVAAQPAHDSAVTRERTVTRVADGVYVIRHPDAPDTFPQSNTTVIIGERDVLVVDACYLPSSAAEDIAQIREWTDKPVRYLLNTHWHYDHTMGNGVYAEAFPGLAIIAHTQTARQMTGFNPGWFARFPQRADRFRQILESGNDPDGNPLSEEEKKEYADAIAGIAPVQAEFAKLVDRLPNLTFDQSLALDLGNREVQIKHLGRGNTAGDAIVYLPQEQIAAAGDLLVHPVPYLGGGFPFDMVTTLERLAQLPVRTIVPGHGNMLQGDYARAYLAQVTDFVRTVTTQVEHEVYRVGNGPRNLDAVRAAVLQAIDVDGWRQKFVGGNPDNLGMFDDFSLPGVVTAAYAQIWGR